MNKSLPQTNEHSASWSVAIGLALLIGLLGSAVLTRRTNIGIHTSLSHRQNEPLHVALN